MQCARKGHAAVDMVPVAQRRIEEKDKMKKRKTAIYSDINPEKSYLPIPVLGYEKVIVWPVKHEAYFQCPSCLTILGQITYMIAIKGNVTKDQLMIKYPGGFRCSDVFNYGPDPYISIYPPSEEDFQEFKLPRHILLEEVDKIPDDAYPGFIPYSH